MAAIFHSTEYELIGFHTTPMDGSSWMHDRENVRYGNIACAINLIPVIGNLIAGAIHIFAASREDWDRPMLTRGIIELTIVGGMLLALADVIFLIGRVCTSPQEKRV